jgi:4-amino-4-deoxy-L-arabinose transferase-like glycosyltransferase
MDRPGSRLFDDIRAVVNGERLEAVEMLLWIWTFVIVVFFTLSTFKLDHYVFPAAPALCLLCARAWFDLRNARLSPRHAGARVGLQLVGPLVVAMGIACGYLLVVRLELPALRDTVPVTRPLSAFHGPRQPA